jgi:glycosyltransferase involved in cell wall biosynthesis/predicted Zn-dependent protease
MAPRLKRLECAPFDDAGDELGMPDTRSRSVPKNGNIDARGIQENLRKLHVLAVSLAKNGHHAEAVAVLERAARIRPHDKIIARLLSDALASQNRLTEALQALEPGLKNNPSDLACLRMAAALHRRLGNMEQAVSLSRQIRQRDPQYLRELLAALLAATRYDEVLAKARNLLAANSKDPRDYHACCNVFLRCGVSPDEIEQARRRLIACAGANGSEAFWQARLLREKGDLDGAIEKLDDALLAAPGNVNLVKERANCALAAGHWGRDAAILSNARAAAAAFSPLSCGIARAERLLQACGGSLEKAVRYPQLFAHVKTPESVFKLVARRPTAAPDLKNRRGIAMVIGSLAAGGAERVQATLYRHLSQDSQFAPAKLYVNDLEHKTGKDFYLPLTGLSASEVVVLDQQSAVREPLSWLPRWQGQMAARILKQLEQDRPSVLHAALEPLSLLAALAGIAAGVPRIFLHTHNMRPTELAAGGMRMRECYQALLERPEVSLISCAHASARDYAEWLTCRSSIHVVHNGFDLEQFVEAGRNGDSEDLRKSLGIAADTAVVGTAFRFVELKQPFVWVDAAAEVLRRRPDCHFVMFGDGELRAATMDYIRALGLADRFSLPGCVADLQRWLSVFDLFVLSSRTEALPNVLLEAQAARVPVVSFDVGGVRETMIEGVTGILASGFSAHALADEIAWALDCPGWRVNAGRLGRTFVQQAFSADGMLRNLKSILMPPHDICHGGEEVSLEIAA